jgi:hypothetical protein
LLVTHWRAILGVDLGHFDPMRAGDEARFAARTLGSRLIGFEVGNEPDGYSGVFPGLRPRTYSVTSYLQEVAAYTAAMRAQAPAMHLYGPDASTIGWLRSIAVNGQTSIAVITEHFYPTTYGFSSTKCPTTPLPTALALLSPQVRQQESADLEALRAAGRIAHRATRISETNNSTSSCDAGPDIGPAFASALWSLDWALRSAESGVSGINFHGWVGDCGPTTFSPICERSAAGTTRGLAVARPEYYGLFAARQLEGGRFVSVQLGRLAAGGDLTAYATLHSGHVITVAVDNFATADGVALSLQVPGYTRATEEVLAAPSINSTDGVTFGNASFSTTGGLRVKRTTTLKINGRFPLPVAPASAYIVTLYR